MAAGKSSHTDTTLQSARARPVATDLPSLVPHPPPPKLGQPPGTTADTDWETQTRSTGRVTREETAATITPGDRDAAEVRAHCSDDHLTSEWGVISERSELSGIRVTRVRSRVSEWQPVAVVAAVQPPRPETTQRGREWGCGQERGVRSVTILPVTQAGCSPYTQQGD